MLGPIPSRVRYGAGMHCSKILIKAKDFDRTRDIVRAALMDVEKETRNKKLQFRVKVDPLET